MDMVTRKYRTLTSVAGPLICVKGLAKGSYGEMCSIETASGELRTGQILKLFGDTAIVQVLEGTHGIDTDISSVTPKGEVARVGVSEDMLGRVFNGTGAPVDGLPSILPESFRDINGLPMNPVARAKPEDFIETGISAIDGLNTLVRGQKLPIFSAAGLPANEVVLQVIREARVKDGKKGSGFCIVFAAIGITSREAFYFREGIAATESMARTVSFINLANDPTVERLFTPRIALTTAEYLAFEKGYHVMVVLTDMTAYCDALREIGSARDEIPGRRSYPGYMYTDLATIYERAGRLKTKKSGKSVGGSADGSITVMPVLTMPEDDITHPIPDLTGYITEGQIVLSRSLHSKNIFPPIDALPCLSRLMNMGIGEGKTREGHRELTDQLYASYAKGVDTRRLVSVVGEEGLTDLDRSYLSFADRFEREFIGQGEGGRTIDETLDLGERLLKILPERELTRLK